MTPNRRGTLPTVPSHWPPVVRKVVDALMGYKPEKIIMFGSMARGEADEYSDIDLILVKETGQRFIRRQVEAISFVDKEIRPDEIRVDIFVYTPNEFQSMVEDGNPFMERALAEGIVLYENTAGYSPALAGPS